MASFELNYDEVEDALEVYFETFDEHFARTIPLNDNIVLYTDMAFSVVWGMAFYDYSRLLEVSETYLDGLLPLPEAQRQKTLSLFAAPPANLLLEVLDVAGLRALVKSPSLHELMTYGPGVP
jgi:hypothetical protein